MNTQLILYPQRYKGFSSSFTAGVPPEFLVDGNSFLHLNISSTITIAGSYVDILAAQPASIVNTWYRHRETALVQYPFRNALGQLVMDAVSGSYNATNVYQKLSGLIIGNEYEVVINFASNTSGIGYILMINGNTLSATVQNGFSVWGAGTQASLTYTATSSSDIVLIGWQDNTTTTLVIENITVTPAIVNPSGVYTSLADGQVICDLYQEEDIPLTLSIDDFKNVAEQVKSYSKDFNLPATKRNNLIFNNMFEITRADDKLIFNPYVRTQCVLKQDGFIIFEGYLRMIDIKDKEGEISYNVNLYSEVVAVADILKDRKFSDLIFTELEHEYNRTQIQNSWEVSGVTFLNSGTSGFRDADTVKYPFIDWNHQIYPDSTGNAALDRLESAFRPCIQLKYLIDQIFAATDFFYTSDFFNTTEFKKLYMDFNWGSENAPVIYTKTTQFTKTPFQAITGSYADLIFTEYTSSPPADEFGYDDSTGVFTAQRDGQIYTVSSDIPFEAGLADGDLEIQIMVNGVQQDYFIQPYLQQQIFNFFWTWTVGPIDAGDTWSLQAKKTGLISMGDVDPMSILQVSTSVYETTNASLLQTLRGETGQWDFLKGIFTMFNLITMADEDNENNILIEPYGEIFIKNTKGTTLANRSIQHDWTDKVDVSQMELKPLTDLNKKTVFKFVEDSDDYNFNVFKDAQGGHLYGSYVHPADAFTILDGEKEIVAEPFAATVIRPLMTQYPDLIIPVIYSQGSDDDWEGFDNSPRIFYNNGKKTLTQSKYVVPTQNGVGGSTKAAFLQFSHIDTIPSTTGSVDFVFSSDQLADGVTLNGPPVDNLYSMYWQPYFNELYNADTRVMTLKVDLSAADISTFKFTDLVMIKNRSFRVNKIEYKPNTLAKVEFILIP
tara:strand:+ start:633 stop:3308 length:2676 start_codon:yes stop_codon:yes gene_type:complete